MVFGGFAGSGAKAIAYLKNSPHMSQPFSISDEEKDNTGGRAYVDNRLLKGFGCTEDRALYNLPFYPTLRFIFG